MIVGGRSIVRSKPPSPESGATPDVNFLVDRYEFQFYFLRANPARNFTQDASGNTLSDVAASLSTNYTAAYSSEGRLTSLTQGSYYGVEFAYDALGQRVRNSVWSALGTTAQRSNWPVPTGSL